MFSFIDYQNKQSSKDSNDMYSSIVSKQILPLFDNLFDQSRFFIIKSSNVENIKTSQMHNEWATTFSNQKRVNEAFQGKEFIILIFSANKSRSYQGFAVMSSYVSDKIASFWNNENGVKLGGCFSVQWLVTCELSFQKVTNLTNSLNNENVIKSRDTTELDKVVGRQLCQMCIEKEAEEVSTTNRGYHYNIEFGLPKLYEEIKKNKDKNDNKNNRQALGFPQANNINLSNSLPGMMPGNAFSPQMLLQFQLYAKKQILEEKYRERSRDRNN